MTHEPALDPAELTPLLPRQVSGTGASSWPELRIAGAKTITSALAGTLRADARSRAEFFTLAGISPP